MTRKDAPLIVTSGWSVEPNIWDPPLIEEGDIVTFEGSPRKFRAVNKQTEQGVSMCQLVEIEES